MVIYSNEIKDSLDKIYFYELSHGGTADFPIYNYYENKLRNIDKLSKRIQSTTFPLSRDRLFGIIIGRLEFGYFFDGQNASVEYYINREPQNDWFDWLIRECVKPLYNVVYLDESLKSLMHRMDNLPNRPRII